MLILKKEYTKNAHKVEISVSSSSPEITTIASLLGIITNIFYA